MFNEPKETKVNVSSILSKLPQKSIETNTVKRLKTFSLKNEEEIKKRGNEPLVFSFVLLDRKHEAFNLGDLEKVCEHWFVELLDCLKELSGLTWIEIQQNYNKTYDPHKHEWDKVNFRFEFDEQTLEQYEGIQIRISKSKGRIHGFRVGNVFYIYWLDPHHNMYDDEKYGGVYWAKYPTISCCEKQNEIIRKLAEDADVAFSLAEQTETENKKLKDELMQLKRQLKSM